jgi:hypothetical protein
MTQGTNMKTRIEGWFSILMGACFALSWCMASAAGDDTTRSTADRPVKVVLELRDGSRIVGEPSQTQWLFTTPVGKLDLKLIQISLVERLSSENLRITFKNGDKLSGVFEQDQIEVKTSFGSQKIGFDQVKLVRISAAGARAGVEFDMQHRVEVPYAPSLQFGTSPFTISFWFKTTSSRNILSPISKRISAATGDGWVVELVQDQILFYCAGCASPKTDPVNVRDGLWHHLAITRAGGQLIFYLDNQMVGAGQDSCNHNDSHALRIGMDGDDEGSWHFDGEISEVHLYKRALSAGEVSEEWNGGRGIDQAVDAGGLIAGYHLTRQQAIEPDFSDHGLNGRWISAGKRTVIGEP